MSGAQYFYIIAFADYPGIDDLILSIFLSSVTSTMIAGSIQSLFFYREFLQVFVLLRRIEQMLAMKLEVDFGKFSRTFLKLVYSIIVLNIVSIALTYVVRLNNSMDFKVNCLLYTYASCTEVQVIHALFYVELLHTLLKFTAQHVGEVASNCAARPSRLDKSKVHDEINYLKVAHYNLWKLTNIINHIFSFTLVSIPLQQFANSVYCVYYVFIETITPGLGNQAIRKSN